MSKDRSSAPKIALGLSLILLGILLFIGRKDLDMAQSTTFENEPVKVELKITDSTDENKIPKRIIVPSLNIDLEIIKAEIINGYWEVFNDRAAWGIGSGYPGENGNQIIFAHARENLFKSLQYIKVDDNIYILNNIGWYLYKVKDRREVYPDQIESIAPTEDETLTLYTCSGYSDSKRLIIIAKRV